MVKSVDQGPEDVRTSPVDTKVSKFPSARSLNDNAVTTDRGNTLCNCSDARVSRSRFTLEFYEVYVAGPDAQKLGPGAAYANSSFSRIRIFEAYLKRLIGWLVSRIP
jgi:hypothetical protein